MKKGFYRLVAFFSGGGIVVCDVLSKRYALKHLVAPLTALFPYGGQPVFSKFLGGIDFSLNLVKNKGAAWGLLSQYPQLLVYTRIGIVLFLGWKVFFSKMGFFRAFSLLLICVGACGNLIDYFIYGYVIDLFHVTFWGHSFPVFNVADASIFSGTVCLLLSKDKASIL